MNHWVMAFPYLMYLASIGTCSSTPQAIGDTFTYPTDVVLGIADIYYSSGTRFYTATELNIHTSYISTCLSYSILLTLMIVFRLMVHIKNIRNATGALNGSGGLHTATATVVTMLIESYALYAVVLLAYVVSRAVDSWVTTLFTGVVGAVQVRVVLTIPDYW